MWFFKPFSHIHFTTNFSHCIDNLEVMDIMRSPSSLVGCCVCFWYRGTKFSFPLFRPALCSYDGIEYVTCHLCLVGHIIVLQQPNIFYSWMNTLSDDSSRRIIPTSIFWKCAQGADSAAAEVCHFWHLKSSPISLKLNSHQFAFFNDQKRTITSWDM